MNTRSSSPQSARVDPARSQCAACRAEVTLRDGVARTGDDRRRRITYADADIVVWECPACGTTNADECGEI